MKYYNYLKKDEIDVIMLIEAMVLMDSLECNEGLKDDFQTMMKKLKDKFNKVIKKTGLHIEKSDGLIQQLIKAGGNVGKLIYYVFMAYYNNDNEMKKKAQEIASSVTKEQIMDFLLKLDTVTLHLLTGPIHTLDALTGLHIWPNIKDKIEPITKKAKIAIEKLEDLKHELEGKFKQQVQKYTNALRRVFDIGDHKKIMEEIIGSDIAEPDVKIGDCPVTRKPMNKCNCKKCKIRRALENEI
jgi:hypothetical protein